MYFSKPGRCRSCYLQALILAFSFTTDYIKSMIDLQMILGACQLGGRKGQMANIKMDLL